MAKTILLADDSSTIRKIVELTFAGSDVRVVAVADGREALDTLERTRPDLVLADVVMPAPDGYEVCRTIKASERPIPVLLLAGTFEPFDPDHADDVAADDALVKPFESDVLRRRVRELLSAPPPARRPKPLPQERASQAPATSRPAPAPSRALIVGEPATPSAENRPAAGRPHGDTPHRERSGGDRPLAAALAVEEAIVEAAVGAASRCDTPAAPSSSRRALTVTLDDVEALSADRSAQDETTPNELTLTAEQLDELTHRVLDRLTGDVVRDWVREHLPTIAERAVAARIRELERMDREEG